MSVGYRRQTASAVHHVVNVHRFLFNPPLSRRSSFSLVGLFLSLSLFPVSSLINAFIRLPFQLLLSFLLYAQISFVFALSLSLSHSLFFSSSTHHHFLPFHRSAILFFSFLFFLETTTSSRLPLNSRSPAGALTNNCTSTWKRQTERTLPHGFSVVFWLAGSFHDFCPPFKFNLRDRGRLSINFPLQR